MNTQNPNFCHVRCMMKPSMKSGIYKVYILLNKTVLLQILNQHLVNVLLSKLIISKCLQIFILRIFLHRKSATCTHVSALLHGLVAMSPTAFLQRSNSECDDLPITSYPCMWKQPNEKRNKFANM